MNQISPIQIPTNTGLANLELLDEESRQAMILALLEITYLPSEATLATMNEKTAANFIRWSEYVSETFATHCKTQADLCDEKNLKERMKRWRLLDAADHAMGATANYRETTAQMVEMKYLAPRSLN